MREIREGDDANESLVAVEHRQTSYLELRHVVRYVLDILVLEAISDRFGGHDLPHGGALGVATVRVTSNSDVTVGQHADQAVILRDREGAGVRLRHQLRSVLQRVVGTR